MSKVRIIAVGKLKERYFAEAAMEYSKRLSRFCDFSVLEIPDSSDGPGSRERESAAVLPRLAGYTVLCDIGGEQLSSEELAGLIGNVFLNGQSSIDFIIGGSNGVTDELKNRAARRISFGKVTYPHQLMRVLLSEQIYRAFTIINNLPYHK